MHILFCSQQMSELASKPWQILKDTKRNFSKQKNLKYLPNSNLQDKWYVMQFKSWKKGVLIMSTILTRVKGDKL